MYRRPLQSAVKQLLNASASRAILGKAIEHDVCQSRALVSCRAAARETAIFSPSQYRALHSTGELFNVKETPQTTDEELGAFTKLIEAMGFTGPLKYNKWKIKIAALRMYTCCVERVNYDEFFERSRAFPNSLDDDDDDDDVLNFLPECSLPDTLNSWFLVAQLHVWMCLVRMRQEGREGKYMCRYIVHSMWEDVEQRSKIMGIDPIQRKQSMKVMTEIFYAALFGYDEGILSDDCVLAAAIWRNIFSRQCEDPRQLEMMVEYVRKQMQFIDSLVGEDLLLTGDVKWRPLLEENAQSILKPSNPTYNDAGL
ncbi:hypothetical protein DNTS_004760 [Danionella cerebrum]|uniref:Ubiquinol-cytochrome c chaperone domain-containing protein n=1 Tax=Danionella cerebrum TaxID=2873325 RepID=A0A553NN01_9TELE|nr:hypothetical protein DNTS_004760 [Danionella translucida]TRY66806.1 hypothetical protein DNTS_004760 [Danionella translucida]